MKKESVEEFVERVLRESKIDIDIEYCKKHNIKFPSRGEEESDDEIWARLGDTERNKKIFDKVSNLSK
jgi:hypothetical protein